VREDLEKIINEFIVSNFLFGDDTLVSPETSFIEGGVIDSTGILELITFIEDTFHFKIEDHEIVPENLDSIRKVAAFIARKCEENTPSELGLAN
jgi:acyl carrier protein